MLRPTVRCDRGPIRASCTDSFAEIRSGRGLGHVRRSARGRADGLGRQRRGLDVDGRRPSGTRRRSVGHGLAETLGNEVVLGPADESRRGIQLRRAAGSGRRFSCGLGRLDRCRRGGRDRYGRGRRRLRGGGRLDRAGGWICLGCDRYGRRRHGLDRRNNLARLRRSGRRGLLCSSRRGFDGGKEQERIDVSLGIGRHAQSEVHERFCACRSDDGAFRNRHATLGLDRAEVEQRRRVAERGLDRDRLSAAGDRPGERHGPVRGRTYGCPFCGADVDSPVLSPGIRMRGVEDERAQHGPVDRPRPRTRRRR